MISGEIVCFKEEKNPSTTLIADCLALPVLDGAREQKARGGAGRCDHNPTLLRAEMRILPHLESKLTDIEGNSLIIIVYE